MRRYAGQACRRRGPAERQGAGTRWPPVAL